MIVVRDGRLHHSQISTSRERKAQMISIVALDDAKAPASQTSAIVRR
jgi:hypothetical protein